MNQNPKKAARSKHPEGDLGATAVVGDALPPHSVEAEEAVLACVFLGPEESMSECEERGVAESWFYLVAHRLIWTALAGLYGEGRPIDVVTAMQWLKDRGGLEQCGGLEVLAPLPDKVASAASLPYYLDIVREKWTRRRILANALEAMAAARDEQNEIGRVIADTERAALALSEDNTGHAEQKLRELVLANIDDLENYHRGSAQITGLTMGLSYADKVTGGLGGENGNLILIGARPGTGKTSLGNDLLLHAALNHQWFKAVTLEEFRRRHPAIQTDPNLLPEGYTLADVMPDGYVMARDGSVAFERHTGIPCVFFSLEMTAKRLVRRMLFQHSGSDLQRFRTGFAHAEDFKKIGDSAMKLGKADIWIDDTSRLTMDMFKARCRRMVRQYGIKLIVVDYVQIIMPERARGQRPDRVTEMEEISSQLRALGKELNVPLVVLAQLNRDVAKAEKWRPPQMTDLANCDALARDADVIMLLYEARLKEEKEEIWDTQWREMARRAGVDAAGDWSKKFKRIDLLVDKNRDGMTGNCELVFECSSTHFHDYGDWQKKHGLKALAAGEAKRLGPDRGELDTGGE